MLSYPCHLSRWPSCNGSLNEYNIYDAMSSSSRWCHFVLSRCLVPCDDNYRPWEGRLRRELARSRRLREGSIRTLKSGGSRRIGG